MKPKELQYSYKKVLGFTNQQKKAFETLESYGINVNQFIRASIKEKLHIKLIISIFVLQFTMKNFIKRPTKYHCLKLNSLASGLPLITGRHFYYGWSL